MKSYIHFIIFSARQEVEIQLRAFMGVYICTFLLIRYIPVSKMCH